MTKQEPATEKQLAFMKQLGIPEPETYSKDGARAIIDHQLEQNKKKVEEKPGPYLVSAAKATQKAPVKEFHLSPEQVRTNALQAAIEMHGDQTSDPDAMIQMAKKYEAYIQNGL